MPTVLYGIKNCDTVKKARNWLETAGIDFQFHDFRQHGLSATKLTNWLDTLGTDILINKRSTTWKQLSEADKQKIIRSEGNLVILEHPTLIKRPVLEHAAQVSCGFSADKYQNIISGKSL